MTGRRLRLRPLASADAAALAEAVEASRAVLRRRFGWVDGSVGPADSARFIAEQAWAWDSGCACAFGVFELRSRRLVGVASLSSIAPQAKAEFSLWIRPQDRDKGYAVEAGRLVTERAFRRLSLHRIHARIDPANRAARKVLQRLGFRYEGCLRADKRLHARWIDQECWGMLRSEWKR